MGVRGVGTRAMVLRKFGEDGAGALYRCYYRHLDGYPSGLGAMLIEALRSSFVRSWDQLVEYCNLKDENVVVGRPEDAFLRVQGDLDYIYVVQENPRGLRIYRTSNPYPLPPFAFLVWASYQRYFPAPKDVVRKMADVEAMANLILNALESYHKALRAN